MPAPGEALSEGAPSASEGARRPSWLAAATKASLKVAACLAAGAALNVLVAWACTFWWPAPVKTLWAQASPTKPRMVPQVPAEWGDPFSVECERTPLGARLRGTWVLLISPAQQRVYARTRQGDGRGSAPEDTRLFITDVLEFRYGLPWLCLGQGLLPSDRAAASQQIASMRGSASMQDCIDLGNVAPNVLTSSVAGHYLPLRVLLPEFLYGWIFWSALIWAAFTVAPVLRRARRARAGHCSACDYPIGPSPVCTECGSPVSARRKGASAWRITAPSAAHPSPDAP